MNNTFSLIGFRSIAYTSKRTGRPVEGVEIHYTYPVSDYQKRAGAYAGVLTDKAFISSKVFKAANLAPGDDFVLLYDKNGRVVDIRDVD